MDFDVKKYASLAKIRLTNEEEKKFQKDLGEILDHIETLKQVKVDNISPMTGGTSFKNVFRKDESKKDDLIDPQFVKEENSYLKVPKILDNE